MASNKNLKVNIGLAASTIHLASKLHEFKSPILAEAYEDIEGLGMLSPAGAGLLAEIPYLKDQLISEVFKLRKPQRLIGNGTGYYYLRKLSRPECKAYYRACSIQHGYNIPIVDWLSSRFDTMEEFLECSFAWGLTDQGHDYWEQIATRARWATQKRQLSGKEIYDALLEMQENLNNQPF